MIGRPVAASLCFLCLAAAVTSTRVPAFGEDRLDMVVARVGTSAITVGDLEQRLHALPDFQLAAMALTPEAIRRQFLERVLIEEALFAEGARARRLEQSLPVRTKIQDALRVARLDLVREGTSITAAEVEAFYRDNRARFDTPPRISISRILCATKDEATSLLAEAKAHGGVQRWNDLVREHSVDKTTFLRGGSLGFVAADGSSSEANVRVNPALFSAAERVKDGEFVPEPVAEGTSFAVIWRKGSLPAVHRTLEDEASAIRQILLRQKIAMTVRTLLDQLRAEQKVEKSPQLLDVLEIDPSGEVGQRKRPGVAERKKTSAAPNPTATPRGLR